MRPSRLWDETGQAIPLAARLGRGGEGNVYAVAGSDSLAAKVYHSPPTAERAAKLAAMVRLGRPPTGGLTAWPLALLYAGGDLPRGLLLPRIRGRPIHVLYGPKSRLAAFPEAGWDFLVGAAAHLAQALAAVHDAGQVVGDVNHANALVDRAGIVRLIDCDSFQISAAGHQFLCEVGVSTHLAPELQGRPLRGPRTPNHDLFGLAVLVFQLLFLGRHPFSGRPLDGADRTLEEAMSEFRFAYGAEAPARGVARPPHAPALDIVSSEVAALFERAFAPRSVTAGRPAADEWAAALGALANLLRACPAAPAHRFRQGLAICPWCQIEEAAGAWLFPTGAADGEGAFDLRRAWDAIVAAPSPAPEPPLPAPPVLRAQPTVRRTLLARTLVRAGLIGLLLGVSLAGVAWLDSGCAFVALLAVILIGGSVGVVTDLAWRRSQRRDARERLALVEHRLASLERRWRHEVDAVAYRRRRNELAAARDAYLGLRVAPRAEQDDENRELRHELARRLAAGSADLRRLTSRGRAWRQRARLQLVRLQAERAQALADLHAAGGP